MIVRQCYGSRLAGEWADGPGGRTCDVLVLAVVVEDNEAGDTDRADAGWVVSI